MGGGHASPGSRNAGVVQGRDGWRRARVVPQLRIYITKVYKRVMEDVDPKELVRALVVVSTRLTRAFRRLIGNESELVTLRALAVVEQYQPVRVGHFAQGYLSSQPAATKLLARLEDEGLVSRETSPTDRRASQFSLTDLGRVRLAKYRTIMTEQMVPYFEGLSAEDRLRVHRALGLVGEYLHNEHPVDRDEGVDNEAFGTPGDDGVPVLPGTITDELTDGEAASTTDTTDNGKGKQERR